MLLNMGFFLKFGLRKRKGFPTGLRRRQFKLRHYPSVHYISWCIQKLRKVEILHFLMLFMHSPSRFIGLNEVLDFHRQYGKVTKLKQYHQYMTWMKPIARLMLFFPQFMIQNNFHKF